MMTADDAPTILVVGASRGLGHAIAKQFLERGWHVIGTVRSSAPNTPLHELAGQSDNRLEVETVDIDQPNQISALRDRIHGRVLDILFVNAGTTTHDENVRVGKVSTAEFNRVMLTNALGPMRVIEAMQDLVPDDGLIGAMTSGQGSITNNETGGREIYRSSKAALNQFMRSFAARQPHTGRTHLLTAPGWVRTDLGGEEAPYSIDDTIPALVGHILAQRRTPGIRYLDWQGSTVPW